MNKTHRLLSWSSRLAVGLLVAAATVQPVVARDDHEERGRRAAMFRAGQAERMQQRAARGGQQREAAIQRTQEREAAPVQAPPSFGPPEAPQQDRGGRPGRLTPDERRALRQQINEAGRDVYRPRQP